MKKLFSLFLFVAFALSSVAQTSMSKDDRMQWWRDARFGMFIHWGIYAVPAGEYKGDKNHAEWIMNTANIPIPEYEKYAASFNPTSFNADSWVAMAKDAGMKYIVITSKHHDGFCLWDSKVSDYDVMDKTPFKRDIMKELSEACKKYGVVFCMYHSIMDWHHPLENKNDINRYNQEYLRPCLEELVTKYDPGVLWFDGEWVDEWTKPKGDSLYNWLLTLKPNLIINNRVSKGRNGMQGMNKDDAAGDFGTPEQEILTEKTTEDWESCMTMNDHWGFNKNDNNFKTSNQLIWNLVDIASKGGNYLLNIGPTAAGLFPDSSVLRLKEIGEWMRINGAAVYGAKTWDSFGEGANIRYATSKEGKLFVYLNGWPKASVTLKKIKPTPGTKIMLNGFEAPLEWRQSEEGLVIFFPAAPPSNPGRAGVYVLNLEGSAQSLATAPQIGNPDEAKLKSKVVSGVSERVAISSIENGATIRFTTDGTEPNLGSAVYASPILVTKSGLLKAVSYVPGKMPSETSELTIVKGKHALTLAPNYANQYSAMGPVSLVDGIKGNAKDFHKNWLGFEQKNVEAVIDLGTAKSINKVSGSFLKRHSEWIFLPKQFTVYTSVDGKKYQLLTAQKVAAPKSAEAADVVKISATKKVKARYVKVVATNTGVCPSWHAGNGGKAWLFCDEITVE